MAGDWLYTYNLSIGGGENTTTGTGYFTVVDFGATVALPTFALDAPFSTQGGTFSVTTPPVALPPAALGSYSGPDSLGIPDIELTLNGQDDSGSPLTTAPFGTLTAYSPNGPAIGSYGSYDFYPPGAGIGNPLGADPNSSPALVATGPIGPPVPLPATFLGGGVLLAACAAAKLKSKGVLGARLV
jgi:hypothetical protein